MTRPTFEEFVSRAFQFELHVEGIGVTQTILLRPMAGGERLMISVDERPDGPLPSWLIAHYCKALNLKPHDFGVFIG